MMPDWIDHVAQVVIDTTGDLCQNRSLAQVFGIISAVSATCIFAGAVVALLTGTNLSTLAWAALAVLVLFLLCCSLYCFLAER